MKFLKINFKLIWVIFILINVGCTGIVSPEFSDNVSDVTNMFSTNNVKTTHPYFVLILDTSGSMHEKDEAGLVKIDIAKNTLAEAIDEIPEEKNYISLVRYKGCEVEFLTSLSNMDHNLVKEKIYEINSYGNTPIAESIKRVGERLKNKAKKAIIILISDGKESCRGDPCYEAKRIGNYFNLDLRIHTVGYIVDNATKSQLQCIAKEGGGEYFDVKNSLELSNRLTHIVRTDILNLL